MLLQFNPKTINKTAIFVLTMLVWMNIAVFVLFVPRTSYADPRIYLAQNLAFGRVIPRTRSLTIIIDALGSKVPMCAPSNACDITGGHAACLYFYDFGNVHISLNFPSSVDLHTEEGTKGATLQRMHMFSDVEAFVEGTRQKAYIGGELITDYTAYGKSLSGTVHVEITTY
ncbi:hypothetical protein [Maridesulfovibrio ferrireducens]|uniref:hypothetical protein n=1 Tax=Maridesulfovibrio ferrireducens TaxID=246191 RepID=UPI001A1BFE7B|nr:hypothetical protein [Maridesulfovibrio ferrireducens]MBI9113312.1 DUF4402 domain-containing protein [Maridesulfovibrio ferrireducens]